MRRKVMGVAAFIAIAMVGCAGTASPRSTPRAATMPPPSGFLADYSGLRPSPDEAGRWYTLRGRMKSYEAFIVDKPILLAGSTTRGVRIEPAEAEALTASLQKELTQYLSWQYRITDQPGPGVARVRTAITQVARSRPPGGGAAEEGGGSREMEIVDSVSGQRLAAVVESDFGRDEHMGNSDAPFHDVRTAFTHWSARLMHMLRDVDRLATAE